MELVPDRRVALADCLRGRHRVIEILRPALERGHVRKPEADVLDEDLEVVGALAVREVRMHLARFRVHEERLDSVAVTPEERVRERAVAPEHATAVQVDEQPCHRVEESCPVHARTEREPCEQPSELEGVPEVLGDEDRAAPAPVLRDSHREDRGQPDPLEVGEDGVFALGGQDRQFLERDQRAIDLQEPDEVTRGANVERPEGERVRPVGQRQLPRQIEQPIRAAQPEGWKRAVRHGDCRGATDSMTTMCGPHAGPPRSRCPSRGRPAPVAGESRPR